MKTIVCMKQVPSSNEVRLHPVTKTIIRDGKASVINPFDASALEQAVQIREKLGGSITALSMGILETAELLRDGISRGCDEAVLLSDCAFAGADTLATSYTLSLGVDKIGDFDLILCGKMAVDGDTAQIGPELAQTLGIPYATDVIEILEVDETKITVKRGIDGGTQVITLPYPALITVVKEIQKPRLPSIQSIGDSLQKEITIYTAPELGADETRTGLNGSPTEVVQTFIPENKVDCVELTGSIAEICKSIATIRQEVK
ncbi:electron transfer flavoprotein subunit beta/FixA family protein [Chakrabartyella piscis]|uniref:electron transfer flavoprotein subunit beta/FixA family protein n=1 Tax=Chakrabartyella piscis TaxID=2918914 RepID=UPI00295862B7|nr:electron transfer flavoprotein subunit beta/FixA family protein [Chakrabartyella piscis]